MTQKNKRLFDGLIEDEKKSNIISPTSIQTMHELTQKNTNSKANVFFTDKFSKNLQDQKANINTLISPISYPINPKNGPICIDLITNKPRNVISNEMKAVALKLGLNEQRIGYKMTFFNQEIEFKVELVRISDFDDFTTVDLEVVNMDKGI